jgi:hypothetical protein
MNASGHIRFNDLTLVDQEKLKTCLVEVSKHMNELDLRRAEETLLENPKLFYLNY